MAEYIEKLSSAEEFPGADGLLSGPGASGDAVTLESGTYRRGEVLMTGEGGAFRKAAEGWGNADELCILAHDIEIPEGDTGKSAAYFKGTFNAGALVLQEGISIEDMRPSLRKHGIFLA